MKWELLGTRAVTINEPVYIRMTKTGDFYRGYRTKALVGFPPVSGRRKGTRFVRLLLVKFAHGQVVAIGTMEHIMQTLLDLTAVKHGFEYTHIDWWGVDGKRKGVEAMAETQEVTKGTNVPEGEMK